MVANLSAEGKFVSQRGDVVVHEVDQPLVEGVVLALHVGEAHHLAEDVLVERPREVALQELVVVNGLGCSNAKDRVSKQSEKFSGD